MLTNASERTSNKLSSGGRWWPVAPSDGDAARLMYENGWNAINQLIREDYSWSGREPNVHYGRRMVGPMIFRVSAVWILWTRPGVRCYRLDGDGNLDILLKSRLGPQVRALQNTCGRGGNAIAFDLRGVKSNRDAIGARVEVDGQVKFLVAGSGYLSQHTKRMHFGLGTAKTAKRITVTWPSGESQTFGSLQAGYRYQLVEGSAEVQQVPFQAQVEWPSVAVTPDNGARAFSTWLLEPVPLPVAAKGPGLVRFDEVTQELALLRRYLFDWRKAVDPPISVY